MQDQPNSKIKKFYNQCIDKAKTYLESRYSLDVCSESDTDYPENITGDSGIVWKIKIENELYPLNYLIFVPTTFPDSLPKIYLSKKDYLELAPLPHVDKNRFVCSRDPEVVYINEEKPGEAIEELIKVVTDEIINRGIKKENIDDFYEEFLAYWNDDADFKILSLISPGESIEELVVAQFDKVILNSVFIVAQSIDQAVNWLSALDVKVEEESFYSALYIPLNEHILPPNKNKDFLDILKNSDWLGDARVMEYLLQGHGFVFISFPLQGERILTGWKQTLPSKVKGFRPGKVPLDIKFQRGKIGKFNVVRLDKERLFNRGGSGLNTPLDNNSLAIIGCGSIGGNVAVSLSKSGVSKFTLIDCEKIEVENIARHVCGFAEVSQRLNKSEAIKKKLQTHFPFIECKSYPDDILSLIQNDESLLNNYDLIIEATANLAVQRRLNSLQRHNMINSPFLYIWIEPFGVAGHMLYIHPSKGGCYQCCMNDYGEFRYSVASNDGNFSKREAGCQSTFIQYSNVDVEHFVAISCKKILSFLESPPQQSVLFTWLGDIENFRSLGYQIKDEWYADSSYSLHKKIHNDHENCKICQKR